MPRRAFQQQTARSRSSSAPGSSQRRDIPRPAPAGGTATAPRQEPDVRRKVWGPGRKRQGQRRSPRRDSRPPPAAKPSSWWSEERRRAREQPSSQAPKVQLLKCVCVGCSFNKNAYILTKRAFSSSLNKCGSPCPASSSAGPPPTEDLEPLRESGGGFIRYERECTLPVVLLPVPLPAGRGCAHSALASGQALCVSSDQNIASGVMQDQGGASVSDTHSPKLAEPAFVSRPDRAVNSSSLADSGQEGHAIPGGRLGVAPEPGTMEPSCVAASGLSEELNALQSRVIDTLTEARAPSTRRLYALKWGVFVKWCHQAHIDPVTCTVLDVLSFLQYRLDSGSLPSTLKVYVAAIAAFRSPQRGQSIVRNAMVVSFLKGARRLHPPRPPSVPPWDLDVVLRALSQPPFEPLTSVGLKELSLKTTLLLALTSAKRIGDLHAFSVDSDCIRFGPGDCSVTLRPRMGYVPKSLSTPFKTQTVSLSALSSESTASREADAQTSVCPVRALRIYIDRSASFRQSDQLFVCYGGCARGRAVSKQRLSHWIVDAITAAYTSQGLECPLHIRGHSTRAIASSWAWSRGMSIRDICVAAGWSSQNTFARFYKLDVQSFASQVLSVSGWCMFCYIVICVLLSRTVSYYSAWPSY